MSQVTTMLTIGDKSWSECCSIKGQKCWPGWLVGYGASVGEVDDWLGSVGCLKKNGWSSNLVELCFFVSLNEKKVSAHWKYPFFRVASKYLQLWIFVLWATVQRGEKKKYWMKMVKHHNAVHTIYGWRAPPDYIAPATTKKISKTAVFQGFS